MMFSYRLVRLVESHADALAAGLEERILSSLLVPHFKNIPAHELRERVYAIYRHLGECLLGNNELDIERRYREIGARRALQNVPLSEVIRAIVLTKENLWEFLRSEAVVDRAIEIMGELELLQMLEIVFRSSHLLCRCGVRRRGSPLARESRAAGCQKQGADEACRCHGNGNTKSA
jgi:hypothetical protein